MKQEKWKRWGLAFVLSALFGWSTACAEEEKTFCLDSVASSKYKLRIGDDVWPVDYPVYRFEMGDVNGDGKTDAILGVVKSTRYDPVVRRRVFLFKNYKGHVRPLWLGSRLGNPIVDFHFLAHEGILRVMEREQDGSFLVADYRWQSFGMQFVRYLLRHASESEARNLLFQAPHEFHSNTK